MVLTVSAGMNFLSTLQLGLILFAVFGVVHSIDIVVMLNAVNCIFLIRMGQYSNSLVEAYRSFEANAS